MSFAPFSVSMSMKSVGWVMRLVGGACPGSGVAVNVTAPVMGPLSCTISVNVPPIAWGLLGVAAAGSAWGVMTAVGGGAPGWLGQGSRKGVVSQVWAWGSGLSVKASVSALKPVRERV